MAGAFVNKNAGSHAAVMAGRSVEMDVVGARVFKSVKTVAAAHRLTGNYLAGLKLNTVRSRQPSRVGYVQDRLITSTDPASLSIEYGHIIRSKNARRVRWVPGQRIMRRGMDMVR